MAVIIVLMVIWHFNIMIFVICSVKSNMLPSSFGKFFARIQMLHTYVGLHVISDATPMHLFMKKITDFS